MENTQSNTVLRRKANAARQDLQARAMSPAKALRLALSRTADKLFGLALSVTGVAQEKITQDRLLQDLDEENLLVLLDGPDGQIGAMSVDFQLVAGLVEMQTTGRVQARAAPKRSPTATDAALFAPLIDRSIAAAEVSLHGSETATCLAGFRFGVMMENRRMLELALSAPDFERFELTVDLCNGAKQGVMSLMLPFCEETAVPIEPEVATGAEGALGQAVMQVPTRIDAVLCRVRVPLSKARGLKVGDVLPLPVGVLSDIALEAGQGLRLAGTRLGKMNGFRAVRLVGREAPPHEAADMAGAGGFEEDSLVPRSYDNGRSETHPTGHEAPHDHAIAADLPELDALTPEEMAQYGLIGDLPPADQADEGADPAASHLLPGLLAGQEM